MLSAPKIKRMSTKNTKYVYIMYIYIYTYIYVNKSTCFNIIFQKLLIIFQTLKIFNDFSGINILYRTPFNPNF